MEHAVYEEIERGGGLSVDDFPVAVVEEGSLCASKTAPSKRGCLLGLWH